MGKNIKKYIGFDVREYVTEHLSEQYQVCFKSVINYNQTLIIINPIPILSFDSLFLCANDYLDLCHTSIYT